LADGKDVFIGTKTGSGKLLSYESIPVPSLYTFRRLHVLRVKRLVKSTNQKQEEPVATMFVNGLELNEQYL
jgi:hypothetical protein